MPPCDRPNVGAHCSVVGNIWLLVCRDIHGDLTAITIYVPNGFIFDALGTNCID